MTANYWLYPTGSNTAPTVVVSGTTPGTAVYDNLIILPADVDNDGGLSPYGTRGQGGNALEWNESAVDGSNNSSSELRVNRGGFWGQSESSLRSSSRSSDDPSADRIYVGFRVASIPEPSAIMLMIGSGLTLLARRRRGLRL